MSGGAQRNIGCRLTKAGRALYYPFWAMYRNDWPVYERRCADPERPRTLRSQCLREVKAVRRLLHEQSFDPPFEKGGQPLDPPFRKGG